MRVISCFQSFVLALGLLLSVESTSLAKGIVLDRIEAVVNSQVILYSDVLNFRRTFFLRTQLDPLFRESPLAKKGKNATHREIVEYLINEKVILSHFGVTDAQVDTEIKEITIRQNINRETLQQYIEQEGYRFDDYFELVRVSLAEKRLTSAEILPKIYISDDDVKNYFYNTSRASTRSSLKYRIRIITISPENYKTKKDARNLAAEALQAIRGGESFIKIAKQYSDHPSASDGGDLGFLAEEDIAEVIRTKIKKLKVGEVSEVIAADSAYFVLKLEDLKSGQEDRLDKMKNQIRQLLTTQEISRQIGLWLERKHGDSYIHRAGDPAVPKNSYDETR